MHSSIKEPLGLDWDAACPRG